MKQNLIHLFIQLCLEPLIKKKMIKNQKIIFQKQVECGQHMQQINIVACVCLIFRPFLLRRYSFDMRSEESNPA